MAVILLIILGIHHIKFYRITVPQRVDSVPRMSLLSSYLDLRKLRGFQLCLAALRAESIKLL